MTNLTQEELDRGLKATEYFFDKYGQKKCEFIMSRIATAVHRYQLTDMIEMGEKIAFFNGWISYEDVSKITK